MPLLNQLAVVSRSHLSISGSSPQCCSQSISLWPGLDSHSAITCFHILVSYQICPAFCFLFSHPVPPQSGDFTLTAEKSPIHLFNSSPHKYQVMTVPVIFYYPSLTFFSQTLQPFPFSLPVNCFFSSFTWSTSPLFFFLFLIITLHHPSVTFLPAMRKGQKIQMRT